jgi:predicted RNA methylase
MPYSFDSQTSKEKILNIIKQTDFVLDLGAGAGKYGKLLKNKVEKIIAVEGFEPYIKSFNLSAFYTEVINTDLRSLDSDFFKNRQISVVIMGDVLEHLNYDEAIVFINLIKEIKIKLIITLPIAIYEQGACHGNALEIHRYQWSDKELQALGFKPLDYSAKDLVAIGTYVL